MKIFNTTPEVYILYESINLKEIVGKKEKVN